MVCSPGVAEIGGHETHGCAGCLDVDDLWHILKGCNDHFRVIAVAQVVGLDMASSHRTDYEGAVADTLGCWQVDTCVQLAWCLDGIFYHTRTLYYIYFSAKVQNKSTYASFRAKSFQNISKNSIGSRALFLSFANNM